MAGAALQLTKFDIRDGFNGAVGNTTLIRLADPDGAAMYSYFMAGELASEGSSITEGIGQGRITGYVVEAVVDLPFRIPDTEALPVIFDLLKHEGLPATEWL